LAAERSSVHILKLLMQFYPELVVAIDQVSCARQQLLRHVHGQRQGGRTALHWAAKQGRVEVVRMLLDACPELGDVKDTVQEHAGQPALLTLTHSIGCAARQDSAALGG
jgi:ankyrin repeat protein